MKVLMFGWEFPPYNSGGLGVACWGLTRALARHGIDVTFVLPKRFPLVAPHCKILFADPSFDFWGVDILLSPYLSSSQYEEERSKTGGIYGHTLKEEVLRYSRLVRDIVKGSSFDVIHAHDWLSFLAGVEAKRLTDLPLIVHVHATEFDRVGNGPVNDFVYDVEKFGMMQADRVVTVSNFTRDMVVEKYSIPQEKVRVVHNGVEETDYLSENGTLELVERLKEEGNKIVLFVGRITLQKGPDYFVRMAERVLEFRPSTYFIVVGSGDMEGRIIREVADRGLSKHFIFAGFLRGEELNSVYRSADLYIMPSVSEPFGITPLEAAANGLPSIVSKKAGVAEVLTHSLRVDFWDTDEMANKVVAALSHDSLRITIGKHAKEELKKINWDEAAQKCIMIYRETIDD